MIISHIVAITRNKVIGRNNKLPWNLPADMQYFKNTTKGHTVIMGRKNYESEGKPLEERINIIVTRQKGFEAPGCYIVNSIDNAIATAKKFEKKEIFIIGGGEIYRQTLNIINKLYLTVIDIELEGDVFYQQPDLNKWKLISKCYYKKDNVNKFSHTYYVYQRLTK